MPDFVRASLWRVLCRINLVQIRCTHIRCKQWFWVYDFYSPDSEAIGVLTSSIGWVENVCFGAGMLVLLQSAAAGCCLRVLLEGAAVRVAFEFSSWPAGAAAGCCCGVLLARNIHTHTHIYTYLCWECIYLNLNACNSYIYMIMLSMFLSLYTF